MNCARCGAAIPPDAKNCAKCGQAADPGDRAEGPVRLTIHLSGEPGGKSRHAAPHRQNVLAKSWDSLLRAVRIRR